MLQPVFSNRVYGTVRCQHTRPFTQMRMEPQRIEENDWQDASVKNEAAEPYCPIPSVLSNSIREAEFPLGDAATAIRTEVDIDTIFDAVRMHWMAAAGRGADAGVVGRAGNVWRRRRACFVLYACFADGRVCVETKKQ